MKNKLEKTIEEKNNHVQELITKYYEFAFNETTHIFSMIEWNNSDLKMTPKLDRSKFLKGLF